MKTYGVLPLIFTYDKDTEESYCEVEFNTEPIPFEQARDEGFSMYLEVAINGEETTKHYDFYFKLKTAFELPNGTYAYGITGQMSCKIEGIVPTKMHIIHVIGTVDVLTGNFNLTLWLKKGQELPKT